MNALAEPSARVRPLRRRNDFDAAPRQAQLRTLEEHIVAQSSYTISKKLFLSFGAAITATLIVAAVAFLSISRMSASVDEIVDHNAKKQLLASAIVLNLSEMTSLVRGVEVRALLKDAATAASYHQQYQHEIAKMTANAAELSQIVSTAQGKEFLQTVTSALPRLTDLNDQIYAKGIGGDIPAAVALYKDDFLPFVKPIREQATQFQEAQNAAMIETAKSARGIVAQASWLTSAMLLLSLAVGAMVVFIVRQINHDLRFTVTSLAEGAEQIAAAATQVSSSSQSLAQGASEQAASIEETSAATEEINSMARRNTENSNSTAAMVSTSLTRFEETDQSLTEMVAAMDGINASSEQISRIIKVIDQIAFQTNILALNAAVEAARAGEAGMGFAVVADEVRNLAQRSAQAAKDTATLIEDSIAKSQAGKRKVDQVATAIRSITADSSKMKLLVDEINLGSQEQSRGIDQISRSISEMEKVTQSNASSAEQSAAAAEQLTAQSQSVQEIVRHLNTLVGAATVVHNGLRPDARTHAASRSEYSNGNGVVGLPRARTGARASKIPFSLASVRPITLARGPKTGASSAGRRSFPLDDQESQEFRDFKEF
jgi:methyl-accepting chemotaxis protein/methyl-accepting chemotaxis protein-1 (serine sensor receptor)